MSNFIAKLFYCLLFVSLPALSLVGQCESFCLRGFCVTADHCEHEQSFVRIPQFDVALIGDTGQPQLRSGWKPPAYFYDRRGHRVVMNVVRREDIQWLVDLEFYPGESGSAVFDSSRSVTGVVLGNRFEGSKTYGRVSILSSALSKASMLPSVRGRLSRSGR